LAWPEAVVAESRDDLSVVFRTYGRQWPVDGRRHVRPPILQVGVAHPVDVVGRYQSALAAGDTEAILHTFGSDGYYREPTGADYIHSGASELHAFFTAYFSAGGGIGLRHCAVTDDGVRCGAHWRTNACAGAASTCRPKPDLPFTSGSDGRLSAVRVYDDVAPVNQPAAEGGVG
jgi:hypothetical protein